MHEMHHALITASELTEITRLVSLLVSCRRMANFFVTGEDILLRRPLPGYSPSDPQTSFRSVAYNFLGVRRNAADIVEFDMPWPNSVLNADTPTYIAIGKLIPMVHGSDYVSAEEHCL